MSPTPPDPTPGRYLDSCGTVYVATKHPKTGWHLQKLSGEKGRPPAAFQKPDFPAAVNAGLFIHQPTP